MGEGRKLELFKKFEDQKRGFRLGTNCRSSPSNSDHNTRIEWVYVRGSKEASPGVENTPKGGQYVMQSKQNLNMEREKPKE